MRRFSALFLLVSTFVIGTVAAQGSKPPLTFDAANDATLFQAFNVPRTWWLSDNSALIYDTRKPAAERKLERLDPANGKRTAFMDADKAKESLARLFPEGQAPPLPPIPQQFS